MKRLINAYLLGNPALRGWLEWGLLALSGIIGLAIPGSIRLPYSPYTNILGALLLAAGFFFHVYSERSHKEAHKRSTEITAIVDRGVYAKIRHPLYLSLIVMDLGIALTFGVLWTLCLACLFSILAVATSLREEHFLLNRFPEQYSRYKVHVRWRMIPGLF
jgi:protein-S-isoprenylcysteine O-methyltransferase Ste14